MNALADAGRDERLSEDTEMMRIPRTARWLFLVLVVVSACSPVVARAFDGAWPPPDLWLPALIFGLFGASLGRTWRRPVSRGQLREYERWRAETELSDEERQVGVPESLDLDVDVQPLPDPQTIERRRRPAIETDPDAYLAAMGRAGMARLEPRAVVVFGGLSAACLVFGIWMLLSRLPLMSSAIFAGLAVLLCLFFGYVAYGALVIITTGHPPKRNEKARRFFARLTEPILKK